MPRNSPGVLHKRLKLTLPDVKTVLNEKLPDVPLSGHLTKSDEHKMLRVLVGALVENAGY